MQIESFFDLIRSRDISNVSIAWQIARGMRDDGDPDFEEFVKAVYGWALSDIPNQLPIDFLANLYNAELKCRVLRKEKIPPVSKAISSLVKKINIEDIQTKDFPQGFEVFDQVNEFYFGTQTIKCLGDQLAVMPALKKLKIESRYDFEITADFLKTTSLESLSISCWNGRVWHQIILAAELPEMENLKELILPSSKLTGPIWDCHQLRILELYDNAHYYHWEKLNEFWKNIPRLVNLEKLVLRFPFRLRFIPEYIYEMTNLRELHILQKNSEPQHVRLSSDIMKMINLQELTLYTLKGNENEWVAHLPRLRRLNIQSKSDFKFISEMMRSYGSQAEVILVA
jgi:hypothetical protein